MFGKIFKILLFLLVAGFVGLTGYAYFGNLSPDQSEMRVPVKLDVD